jgi:uncharacterized protein (DUF58 family)
MRAPLEPVEACTLVAATYAELAGDELEAAVTVLRQTPPRQLDVDRTRDHLSRALRALQELEAELQVRAESSEGFREALARRGGLQ